MSGRKLLDPTAQSFSSIRLHVILETATVDNNDQSYHINTTNRAVCGGNEDGATSCMIIHDTKHEPRFMGCVPSCQWQKEIYVNYKAVGSWTDLPHPASCASLVFQQKNLAKYWLGKNKTFKTNFPVFYILIRKRKTYGENATKSLVYSKTFFFFLSF